MKFLKYLVLGTVFGILMAKAELVSWYRIYEMFRFESFHMYGVIGSAVVLGAISIRIIKKKQAKTFTGDAITISDKEMGFVRYGLGGTIFGLGWAMTGACPGPIFVLIGQGVIGFWVVL
ncbi:MAG: putative membrane protein YedE/YeeE, partial [Sphingobacteriales bacterium]